VLGLALISLSCTEPEKVDAQKSPGINSINAININTASAEELEKIPHVGPKLANEIVNFREGHGRFRRPEYVMLIRGFSDARYREARNFIKTE